MKWFRLNALMLSVRMGRRKDCLDSVACAKAASDVSVHCPESLQNRLHQSATQWFAIGTIDLMAVFLVT